MSAQMIRGENKIGRGKSHVLCVVRRDFAHRFSMEDFPTLGRPTRATLMVESSDTASVDLGLL